MDVSTKNVISEEWIRKKLNITHEGLDDIKMLSLPGTYQEKITHLGNSLQKFIRLKELDLSRNALISLEGIEHLKGLEKLNLYYNNIVSLKELERLRLNPSLIELDLRLNPVTKEENDYRLHLIHLLPSLKVLDDRTIRETERQMAVSFFEQAQAVHSKQPGNDLQSLSSGSGNSLMSNGSQTKQELYQNSASAARVKSVSNIVKRSNGISDNYDDGDLNNLQNYLTMRMASDNANSVPHLNDHMSNGNNYYNSKQPQMDEYTNGHKVDEVEIQQNGYNTLNGFGLQSNSGSLAMGNSYGNHNGAKNGVHGANREPNLVKLKSSSMQNLRANGENDPNKKLVYEDYLNDGQYMGQKAVGVKMPKRMPKDFEGDEFESKNETNGHVLGKPPQSPQDDLPKNHSIFSLLDLVDRYWNGSKSLHKNSKFLGIASQLIGQQPSSCPADQGFPDDNSRALQLQVKSLQEENRRLQQTLFEKMNQTKNGSNEAGNYDGQIKNLIMENDNLKKKLINIQEENKKLRKEYSEKSEKMQNDYAIDCMENQNVSLKRDIEIMKIKLKQYEQLQQLTTMLQESHKSLVTTNEHLLQEINSQKQLLKSAQPPSATAAAAAAAAIFNGLRTQPVNMNGHQNGHRIVQMNQNDSNGHSNVIELNGFSSNGSVPNGKGDINGINSDSSGYITSSMNYPANKSSSLNSSGTLNRKQFEQQLLAGNLTNNRYSFVK